jgi:hypothetical protein
VQIQCNDQNVVIHNEVITATKANEKIAARAENALTCIVNNYLSTSNSGLRSKFSVGKAHVLCGSSRSRYAPVCIDCGSVVDFMAGEPFN